MAVTSISNSAARSRSLRCCSTSAGFGVVGLDADDGVVQIGLLEGRTGEVNVFNNKHTLDSYIKKSFPLSKGALDNTVRVNEHLQWFNGVNDVQSLIVVTILAEACDEAMVANCVDYMGDELCVNVIRVNKLLQSSAGKTARLRLQNPPRYKPKKERKQNMFSSLLGGGGMGM